MFESRRPAVYRIAAIGVIAAGLAACGVKGDLEAPPRANVAEPPAQQTAGATGTTERRAFTEQSEVRRVPYQSILPEIPPKEWQKGNEIQSTQKPKARRTGPDEPFFLDSIL